MEVADFVGSLDGPGTSSIQGSPHPSLEYTDAADANTLYISCADACTTVESRVNVNSTANNVVSAAGANLAIVPIDTDGPRSSAASPTVDGEPNCPLVSRRSSVGMSSEC